MCLCIGVINTPLSQRPESLNQIKQILVKLGPTPQRLWKEFSARLGTNFCQKVWGLSVASSVQNLSTICHNDGNEYFPTSLIPEGLTVNLNGQEMEDVVKY